MNVADFRLAAKVADGRKLTATDLEKVSKPALRTIALVLSERLVAAMDKKKKKE